MSAIAGHIRDVAGRVADRLEEDARGLVVDMFRQVIRAVAIGEADLNAQLGQHVAEERPGAAVELGHGDDVVARFGQVEDRVGDRRLARSQRQRSDAAFHRRHPLLQHIVGRVHDAGVDIAGHRQVEKVGAVLGVIKFIGDGLVYRHRDRLGRRLALIAGMDGLRLEFHRVFSRNRLQLKFSGIL